MSDLVESVAEFMVAQMPAPASVRERLDALEQELLMHPQIEIVPRHYFAKGLYAREITIPAGTLLTGKIHTTQHINIISKGDISVLTEHGPKRIQAPCTLVSPPGTKRAGYAHTDVVWTTIHANPDDLTDPDVLESILITPVYLVEEAACPSLPQP